jgi:hypothetical protein
MSPAGSARLASRGSHVACSATHLYARIYINWLAALVQAHQRATPSRSSQSL